MRLINETRKTTVAEKIIVPSSLLDKSLGLLKYIKPTPMLLKTRFGIHTFGMNYPIDVLILNSNNKVVVMKNNLKPNRIFLWNIMYFLVVELPKGTNVNSRTQLNDQLTLQ